MMSHRRLAITLIIGFIAILSLSLYLAFVQPSEDSSRPYSQTSDKQQTPDSKSPMVSTATTVPPSPTTQEGTRQPRAIDERILLTPQNIKQYVPSYPSCEEDFNADPATTVVFYSNQTKGISLNIPYNPRWGSDKYRINPYDEENEYLLFGPLLTYEACTWERSYALEFLPAKSVEQTIKDVQEYTDLSSGPVKTTINGLVVLKYTISQKFVGQCDWPSLQVIGKKYNYLISPFCSHNITKDFDYLEALVKTVRSIE